MPARDRLVLAATAALAIALLVVGLLPRPLPGTDVAPDLVWHTIGYAGLAWFVARSLRVLRFSGSIALGAVVLAVGHGVLLESLQSLTATRTAEVRDLVADLVGALVAVAVRDLAGRVR